MQQIETVEEFKKFVIEFWENPQNRQPYAFGIGQIFRDSEGTEIATKWLKINVAENAGTAAVLMDAFYEGEEEININEKNAQHVVDTYFAAFLQDGKFHDNIEALSANTDDGLKIIFYFDKNDFMTGVESNADAHFRLAMLSRRYTEPNSICLDSLFDHLPNLVWTHADALTIPDWNKLWVSGEATEMPLAQDFFPPMYWANPAPIGVRVANTRVLRAGHHCSEKSTYMHYAFGNFNSGTLGAAMVEGRIAAGITVGAGSDVGAGAGFLGTLSGGNSTRISVGKNCLIGAMAEVGIPLGDNVLVKEGVVFSGGTPIHVIEWKTKKDGSIKIHKKGNLKGKPIVSEKKSKVVKAIDLAGISNVTFRVNSQTGAIEVLPIPNKVTLNELLQQNN